ncbi:hypothetical protein FPCIR_10288 [Fusarium pseudocircinatum]|uniref:Uncharacterized protein n=1 Tax=Fusarium pseudocircinatum TaxID=56676 RepID=A0A8H5KXG3_9HYPO|nr:hypothetical protein FPCIR_10288 [Fusarium pseudocircinatum]
MPAKGSRKRTAPEPPAEPPAKRGRGRPPGSKNKQKKTPDSEKISQQKAMTHPSRPRAARPIDESSDEDSESESQDQEIPPVTSDQKWDDLLLKPKDRYEAKYVLVLQRYWRKTAAKPHIAGFEGLTKKTYEDKEEPGCPNPTYSKDWSHADEETFLSEYWRGTVHEEAIKRQTRTNQDAQHLVTMFKISLHTFGVDPLTLWTLNGDEFEVTGGRFKAEFKVGNVKYPNPIWSRSFCDKLSQIMTHPLWTKRKERHGFMLFTVKWAFKCRTDDRRPLTEDDLDAVIMGLDELELGVSCETQYGLYQNRRTTHTYPSRAEVADLYRNAFLNIERRRMIDHKTTLVGVQTQNKTYRLLWHGIMDNTSVEIKMPLRVMETILEARVSNEQTNIDRSPPKDIRPPERSSRGETGLASNASRSRTFEADEYVYIPPDNSSSDGEESRRSDQRVRDKEPEGFEEGGDNLLPSTADDKSTSPIAQRTSPETEPLTHTGVEEANDHGLLGDDKEESRHSECRVRDDELESLEQGGGDRHMAFRSALPIAQRTSRATEPLTHTGVEEASDNFQGHGNCKILSIILRLIKTTPPILMDIKTFHNLVGFAPNLLYQQGNEPSNTFSQSHHAPQTQQSQNNGGKQWGRRKKPNKSHEVEQASLCRVESDKGTAAPEIPKVSEGGGSQQKSHRELHHQGTQYEAFGRTTVAQAPARIEPRVCGMCKLPGHEVIQCWAIGEDGFTHGCGVCSSRAHETDQCQHFPEDLRQKIEILVKRRACLPPLKTAFWYNMMWKWVKKNPSTDVNHLFPWTTQFAIDVLSGDHKSAVEKALVNRRNNPDAESSRFVVNPATANWEKVKETYGGDPKNFFEKLRTANGAVQEQRITNAIAQAQAVKVPRQLQLLRAGPSRATPVTTVDTPREMSKRGRVKAAQKYPVFPLAVAEAAMAEVPIDLPVKMEATDEIQWVHR